MPAPLFCGAKKRALNFLIKTNDGFLWHSVHFEQIATNF